MQMFVFHLCVYVCMLSLTRNRPAAATGVYGFMVSRYDMVYLQLTNFKHVLEDRTNQHQTGWS